MHGYLEGLKRLLRNLNGLKECILSDSWIEFDEYESRKSELPFCQRLPFYRKNIGICGNVVCTVSDSEWLRDKFEELGYDSKMFPVESKMKCLHTRYAKMYDDEGHRKYDKRFQYGRIRMKLLDELIELAESEISIRSF